jgi:hypothetical protein
MPHMPPFCRSRDVSKPQLPLSGSARVTNFFLIGGGGICAAILWGAGTGAETLGTGDTENGGIMADTGATAGGKTGAGAE